VKILDCPVALPRLMYYQLWHERTHSSSSARWLRDCIKGVAASLRPAAAASVSRTALPEFTDPP
jgi:DNA-binding transcriptional LysR family regulator